MSEHLIVRTEGGTSPALILALCLAAAPGGLMRAQATPVATNSLARFPCNPEEIAHYTAYRTGEAVHIDGRLDEKGWQRAPRSPRFIDILTGKPTLYDTRAAVLWDDRNLYVGFWVEEPKVKATLTKHGSHIYENNDVEVFIAGRDTYYEFEINALNTVYEAFFIWEDSYDKGGYAEAPEFKRSNPLVVPFNGVGFTNHPRGLRLGSWAFEFLGLKTAVHIDGTLNDDSDTDRGWTVELAFPWQGMKWLANERPLPPREGDVWRMFFGRFEKLTPSGIEVQPHPAWCWNKHGIMDTHRPDRFTCVHFSERLVEDL